MAERVLIIGGGLAGLAAAVALAERGFEITLLEARGRLGGRASSFLDAASGQLIDNCQHVSMGCCTNLAHLLRAVGISHFITRHARLFFMTSDRRLSCFRADPVPAPLHLARSFARAHFLTWKEKLGIGRALLSLQADSARADGSFADWLRRHGQTQGMVERFWGLVLTSALNESPERIGTRYVRKVFVDGFLSDPRGFEIEVPSVPLGRLYGEELLNWCRDHRTRILLNEGVRTIHVSGQRVLNVETRQGATLAADWYVSAVPFDRLLDLLPPKTTAAHACFHDLCHLETSPITSVHLWYDRPVLPLPHVVLVASVGQWVFDRGEAPAGEQYVQVVVSAARQFRGQEHAEIQEAIVDEMARLFPEARKSALRRARVVTEHAATFSAVPGVDRWRPAQATPIDNLFLAGDWTATGWPATMEGAVRSGYLAAEALLLRAGHGPVQIVQADLGFPDKP